MNNSETKSIKESLLDMYVNNNWKKQLVSKPKLRTYIEFKKEYCTEPYVKLNINRFDLLTKLGICSQLVMVLNQYTLK